MELGLVIDALLRTFTRACEEGIDLDLKETGSCSIYRAIACLVIK